jgi:hypothetical protein
MDSCGGVLPGCKRWLTLLGDILGLSLSVEHGECQILG